MRQDEIDRALILVYASNNAHMWANYVIPNERMCKFTSSPIAKKELVKMLRNLADHIEKDYPDYP